MLATSGAFTSRKLQRQAMRAGRRVGGTGRNATGRVRALRRTRSAQVYGNNHHNYHINNIIRYACISEVFDGLHNNCPEWIQLHDPNFVANSLL